MLEETKKIDGLKLYEEKEKSILVGAPGLKFNQDNPDDAIKQIAKGLLIDSGFNELGIGFVVIPEFLAEQLFPL